MGEEHPFEPDWTIAPASMLRFYLEENNLSPRVALAGSVPRHRRDEAAAMLQQVLDKQPLTGEHATLLANATGIPRQFWLTFEHNYRAGLAAGLTDATS
jgi:plasmid maintenance system antidote protein VapI